MPSSDDNPNASWTASRLGMPARMAMGTQSCRAEEAEVIASAAVTDGIAIEVKRDRNKDWRIVHSPPFLREKVSLSDAGTAFSRAVHAALVQ
jgi:hypothetical protein